MLEVQLIGNLGADPEMRYTAEGVAVSSFRVACDVGKDKAPTWVKVSCWDKLAEIVNNHLEKGSRVLVRGRLSLDEWVDGSGKARATLVCTADTLKFLSPKASAELTPEAVAAAF